MEKDREKGSVAIDFVRAALEPVFAQGLDASELLRSVGITREMLETPGTRISAPAFGSLWLGVAKLLDDELFGQDTRRLKVGSFATLCQMLVHCKTLQVALKRMVRFFNLLLDDYQCSLASEGRYARLLIREREREPRIFGHEALLIMQYGVACWLVGRRIPVASAAFSYPEPARSAEYKIMYSPQLRFNAAVTSLNLDRACLDLPVIQNEQTLKEFLRRAPGNIVLKYKNPASLTAQIRRRLHSAHMTRSEWPDFDSFAHSLHMTPSTLRRRLEEEGQSFQSIKDQLRHDLAVSYLARPDKSVQEIAAELGFAEPSAFYRAFRKWTGMSPGEYRQQEKN